MTELNKMEKDFLRAEASARRSYLKWDEKIKKLRAEISKDCRHAQTEEFNWEHDDGYGRQSRHTGLRCVFCLKVNHWPKFNLDSPQSWINQYE